MSNPNPPTVSPNQVSNEEMARDHGWILQNYYDSLIAQGLSANRIENTTWFIERWFERYGVATASGKRPLNLWEAMKPIAGRLRIKAFLKSLSSPGEDGLPCLKPSTVRGYASMLDRFFSSVMEFPYVDHLQTITSKYGPIENPFTGVEYPIHTRDHLRSERFFLTEQQILELLIFLREVYPKLTHRALTAARLYTIILLITETGMRSVEVLNLDSVGENRDIFYDRKIIQTRFGKGHNTSGPLSRLIDLTRPAEITLKEYERNVRPHFRHHAENPALFLDGNGNRHSYSALHSRFTRFMTCARKHGVNLPEKLTIHDLRASFATNYLEAHPKKFWKLMELLGHVSPASTCLYIRCRGKSRTLTMREARGPRVPKASNPFRPWQSETAVWTTSAFDALGRVVSVTTPDSAAVTSSYAGNTVTVTDQAGKARQSVTDSLGRLIQVHEDPAGLNYLTSYDYDPLDDLITVTQGSQTRTFGYDSLKRLTSALNPESGQINYQYDANGNLLVKTDVRGVSSHISYDALNRITRRWYNGSSSLDQVTNNVPALPSGIATSDEVAYFYDSQSLPPGAPPGFSPGYSVGRLVATVYGTGSSAGDYHGYDAAGRPVLKIQQTGGVNYPVSAIYNLADAITTETYPSGRTVTYGYDGAGRTNSFAGNLGGGNPRSYSTGIIYSPFGGTATASSYYSDSYWGAYVPALANDGDRKAAVGQNHPGGWNDNAPGNTFPDWLEIDFSGSKTIDEIDVITEQDNYSNPAEPTEAMTFSQMGLTGYEVQCWNGSGWTDVTGGNVSGNNKVWRKITFAALTTSKIRVLTNASVDGYCRIQELEAWTATSGNSLAQLHWLVSDQLGTPRVIFDQSGSLATVSRHDYLPFGEELTGGGRTSALGYGASDSTRQKFTQKERDIETGLDYFGARYYGSVQGRFTAADPKMLGLKQVVNPQRWNRYAYVLNNPLALYDPDGQDDDGQGGSKVIDVFVAISSKQLHDAGVSVSQEALQRIGDKYGYKVNVHNLEQSTVANVEQSLKTADATFVIGHSGPTIENGVVNKHLELKDGMLGTQGVMTPVDPKNPYSTVTSSPKPESSANVVAMLGCGTDNLGIVVTPTNEQTDYIVLNGGKNAETSVTAGVGALNVLVTG